MNAVFANFSLVRRHHGINSEDGIQITQRLLMKGAYFVPRIFYEEDQ